MILNIITKIGFAYVGFMAVANIASAGPELVAFPAGYQSDHTHYATANRDDERKQVVKMFANEAALASAKDGVPLDSGSVLTMEVYKAKLDASEEPIMGSDGFFEQGDLAGVVVMESQDGFGADYPDELRNGNWEYAIFKGDGSRMEKETTACFECHKPLHDTDYVFSFELLSEAANN